MKYLASIFLIVSIVAVAVFGFSLFDHAMMEGSNGGCIASAIDGTACPTGIMAMTLHHAFALQTLMTTMPPISSWLLLLASLLLISVSIFFSYKNILYPKLEFLRWRLRNAELNLFRSRQKIISWLALFELSPAIN